jgi:hypothetical protein
VIGDDLHGLDQQAWLTTGFLIASTITTLIYGKMSDQNTSGSCNRFPQRNLTRRHQSPRERRVRSKLR